MGGKSNAYGSGGTAGADDREVTQVVLSQDPGADPQRAEPVSPPPHQPTQIAAPPPPTEVLPSSSVTEVVRPVPAAGAEQPHPLTELARPPTAPQPAPQAAPQPAPQAAPDAAAPSSLVAGIVRYGPGVPVVLPDGQGGRTAEHVWRGHPAPGRRPRRLRRLAGSALTVILLAAAGIVLYLRFYHAPLHVTGAAIAGRSPTRCGVRVTGRITTNGGAGTVSYEWLFRPGRQQPARLTQSVAAGQHEVTVVAAIEGSGHGSAAQTVTLQILGPGKKTASTDVVVSC
jgi:hypothetical protein